MACQGWRFRDVGRSVPLTEIQAIPRARDLAPETVDVGLPGALRWLSGDTEKLRKTRATTRIRRSKDPRKSSALDLALPRGFEPLLPA
ncbi:hypothetical protein THIOKS190026 [Thiocapsa sp. KS1]|nr:hypothetical protein THIOKS190026 [Thiocapsa sp. KS1]